MGGEWSHQSREYCQEEDQELHLGDIRIRYRQINGSSGEKEGRFKSEKIIRIKNSYLLNSRSYEHTQMPQRSN